MLDEEVELQHFNTGVFFPLGKPTGLNLDRYRFKIEIMTPLEAINSILICHFSNWLLESDWLIVKVTHTKVLILNIFLADYEG